MNVSTFVDSIVIAKSISQMMDLKNAFLKLDRPYKPLFLILVLSSLYLETKIILSFDTVSEAVRQWNGSEGQ